MHGSKPFLLPTVIIIGVHVTGLHTGVDKSPVQRILHIITVVNRQRSLFRTILVTGESPVICFLEIGQTMLVAPVPGATFLPLIVIHRMTTHINHAIDRRGTAEHLAAGAMHAPVVEIRFRLGFIGPVKFVHIHWNRQGRWHLDKNTFIATTVFEQEYAYGRVFGQTIG